MPIGFTKRVVSKIIRPGIKPGSRVNDDYDDDDEVRDLPRAMPSLGKNQYRLDELMQLAEAGHIRKNGAQWSVEGGYILNDLEVRSLESKGILEDGGVTQMGPGGRPASNQTLGYRVEGDGSPGGPLGIQKSIARHHAANGGTGRVRTLDAFGSGKRENGGIPEPLSVRPVVRGVSETFDPRDLDWDNCNPSDQMRAYEYWAQRNQIRLKDGTYVASEIGQPDRIIDKNIIALLQQKGLLRLGPGGNVIPGGMSSGGSGGFVSHEEMPPDTHLNRGYSRTPGFIRDNIRANLPDRPPENNNRFNPATLEVFAEKGRVVPRGNGFQIQFSATTPAYVLNQGEIIHLRSKGLLISTGSTISANQNQTPSSEFPREGLDPSLGQGQGGVPPADGSRINERSLELFARSNKISVTVGPSTGGEPRHTIKHSVGDGRYVLTLEESQVLINKKLLPPLPPSSSTKPRPSVSGSATPEYDQSTSGGDGSSIISLARNGGIIKLMRGNVSAYVNIEARRELTLTEVEILRKHNLLAEIDRNPVTDHPVAAAIWDG